MRVIKRTLPAGGGKAPANTVTTKKETGASRIKGSATYAPADKGLGMIKGAVTCPNAGGKNSKW